MAKRHTSPEKVAPWADRLALLCLFLLALGLPAPLSRGKEWREEVPPSPKPYFLVVPSLQAEELTFIPGVGPERSRHLRRQLLQLPEGKRRTLASQEWWGAILWKAQNTSVFQ